MSFKKLKNLVLAATVVLGIMAAGATAHAEMTKEEIEKIIHDYIANNGDLILKSVDDFQKKDIKERQDEAMKTHHDELFNNEHSPFIGNEKGDVTIIEFFDYNCHYCKEVLPTLRKVIEEDKGVKVIFKDIPILGATSETAAKWALAAHKQDKYFDFHVKMMSNKGPITDELLQKNAEAVGMDVAKAKKDAESTDVLIQLERNRSLFSSMGFNGTPAFVINDEAFSGSQDDLKAKIAAARDKKK